MGEAAEAWAGEGEGEYSYEGNFYDFNSIESCVLDAGPYEFIEYSDDELMVRIRGDPTSLDIEYSVDGDEAVLDAYPYQRTSNDCF